MLKPLKNLLLFILCISFLLIPYLSYSTAKADRSNIKITVRDSWDPFKYGWEPDECLISSTNTLVYPVPQTDFYGPGNEHYLVNFGPDTKNLGERDDDSAAPRDPISSAEAHALWLTWDTNYLYFAFVAEARGHYYNLMFFIDRGTGNGTEDFSTMSVWRRNIYFSSGWGIKPDWFLGIWCNWAQESPDFDQNSGWQIWSIGTNKVWSQKAIYDPVGNNINPQGAEVYYNGGHEPDRTKRVLLGKIPWTLITNGMSSVSSVTLKIVAAVVGDDHGYTGIDVMDYIPDNLWGVERGKKSVENSYFIVPITDPAGNIIVDVSPIEHVWINFLPGTQFTPSAVIPIKTSLISSGATNTIPEDKVAVFTPNGDGINDRLEIRIDTQKEDFVFDAEATVYDTGGKVVRKLFSGVTIESSSTYKVVWDGKDDSGNLLPPGNYIIIFKGKNGQKFVYGRRVISLVR